MTSSTVEEQMTKSPQVDWKQRCEQLQFEHQLELERIRLHYDQELKDKVAGNHHLKIKFIFFLLLFIEIRSRLKREYDQHFAEFRANLLGQQEQFFQNLNLDSKLPEQIDEQIRLAEAHARFEDKQRQQLADSDLLKRLVNKLHTEGK